MNEKQKLLIAALSASAILSAPSLVKAAEDPANVDKQNQYEAFDVDEPENSQKEKAANEEKSLSVGGKLSDATNIEAAIPPQNLEPQLDPATSSAPETTQNEVPDEKNNQQTQEFEDPVKEKVESSVDSLDSSSETNVVSDSEPEASKEEVKQEEEQATETEEEDDSQASKDVTEDETTTPEAEAEDETTTPKAEAEDEAQAPEAEVSEKTEESQVVKEKLVESAQPEGSAGQSNPQNQEANPTPNTNDGNVTTENQIDATNEFLETNKKTPAAPLKAGQGQSAEPNYAEDEKKIEDYSDEERYRSTEMEQGNGTSYSTVDTPSMDFKDGFRYDTLEPSATSNDKTQWGLEMEFDKEKGQRTYTDFEFTNSGNQAGVLDPGNISANDVGDKLSEKGNFNDPTYKAKAEVEITGSRVQRNENLYSTEEDLKYINNVNTKNSIIIAWEGKYKKDNADGLKATQGPNSSFTFSVNPWPNENDKLELIKLNGSHDQKEFVQGQTITTNVKVDNLDPSARERLVGQVYHPLTGEVVPGAKAYINDEGKVVVEMPDGTINADGSINENSIFYKDAKYKGIQNLEVKFFARPRTAKEFKAIVEANGGYGYYTETGAGTKKINHDGQEVEVDLQGIDRYDHYNLIGGFKLNLDDTRYYDQDFKDKNQDDTSKHTHSKVKPGEEFDVNLYVPTDKKDKDAFPNQKTPEEMEAAKNDKQAIGSIDMSFIDQINKDKEEKDKWVLDYNESTLPTTFKITPPKSAKAGDFVAVPLTYTYTNGSTDVHWFHFVVQESDYIKPDYETQVNFPAKEQTSPATVKDDGKRITPDHYTLPDTIETDKAGNKLVTDDSGNKWTVTLDEETGKVSAKPVNPLDFNGGEKLTVPVISHYKDEQKPDEDITEESEAYFVIEEKANMTPRYNAKAGKSGDELASDVILNTEDKYNRRPGKYTLDSPTYTDDKGNTWNVSIDEKTGQVTATVPNAEEGQSIDGALLNVPVTAHYYEEDGTLEVGTKQTEVQFVASGTEGEHKYTVEIPFETKVEKDSTLKKGEIKVIKTGALGSKEVTLTIKDSEVLKDKTKEEVLVKQQDALIHVGEGVLDGTHRIEDKVAVPFNTIVKFDDSLAPGEQKVEVEGAPGEKTRTITLTIKDGEVTNTETGKFQENKAPVDKVIKVGRNTQGQVVHEEKIPFKYEISYDPNLKSGEYVIDVKGTEGTKTTTWKIKNSKVDGEPTIDEKKPVNAVIRVGQKDFTGEFTHKVKEEIPFTVRVIEDNTLAAGKSEVVTQGQAGEKTTTYTQAIKNGDADGDLKSEENVTKQPVEHVIRVGKKPATNSVNADSDVGVTIKYTYDPTLDVREARNGNFTPGKVTTVVTNEYNPKTGKIESVEKTVITPAVQEIIIGTKKYTGTFENEISEVIPFETKVIFDENLAPGTVKVDEPGVLGEQKKKFIQHFENGVQISTEEQDLGKTDPQDRVVRVGYKTEGSVVYGEEIPFGYTVEYDPEMKAGTYEVVTQGEPGAKVTIWTIKNSKIDGGPTVLKTDPVDAVIKVGSKDFTGTFETKKTDFIEFETIYEIDDTMEPGTTKVVQEGQHGEKETTITHTIKNGEVTESKNGDPVLVKAAVNRIVKVGAAKSNGTHEYTKEIPFEVEVRVNPELKKGEHRIVQKGEAGEEKYTLTIEDSKVTKTSEATRTKAPVKEIVEVGSEDFTGEYSYEKTCPIPFEVKIVEDPTQPKGYKHEEGGEAGSKTTKYTQSIKNGQPDGEAKLEKETINKKPVDKVITIGTGELKGSTEKVLEREVPFDTKYIYDKTMEAGKEEVVNEGKPGKERTTITTNFVDGEGIVTENTEIVTHKIDKLVKVGTKPVEKTESIPHDTTYKHNPELAAGTIVKKSDGTPGTVTITTSFNKETGKLETQVTRTEPTNAVYEYGSKTEGKVTVTSDIPYEVEFVPDDTMVSGETKVEQEGELGKKETTIIIENSVESSRTEKVTKEPVKKIVKYGTLCKVPGTDDPSKPGTEDPGKPGTEDPGKPGTEDPGKPGTEDPGKPGTEDPGKPGTEDPGKPGTEDPGKPGTEDPGKPGTEDPGKPGTEDPGKPGTKDPWHPGTNDPSNPGTEKPDKEGLLKPSDDKPSKPASIDSEIPAEKAFENNEGESAGTTTVTNDNNAGVSAGIATVSNEDYRKAPQTSDPGVGGYLKLGGLATALFAFLQRKKKEADEE